LGEKAGGKRREISCPLPFLCNLGLPHLEASVGFHRPLLNSITPSGVLEGDFHVGKTIFLSPPK